MIFTLVKSNKQLRMNKVDYSKNFNGSGSFSFFVPCNTIPCPELNSTSSFFLSLLKEKNKERMLVYIFKKKIKKEGRKKEITRGCNNKRSCQF